MESQSFRLGPLRGLDQNHVPAPGTMRRLQDVRWDRAGGWREGPGYRRILLTDASKGSDPYINSGKVVSLHQFSQKNGARHFLIYEADTGEIRICNPSKIRTGEPWDTAVYADGTVITGRAVINGPWQGSQSSTWGDLFYLFNGINEPLVFNGDYWDRAGWDVPPGTPSGNALTLAITRVISVGGTETTVAITGMGLAHEGIRAAHAIRVSFVNERGQESMLSGSSGVVITEAVYPASIRWVIPTGPDWAVARNIYRTANLMDSSEEFSTTAEEAIYYYHSTVEDNVSTVIQDTLPDTALGAAVDELDFGPWPPGTKYGCSWDGRHWLVSDDAVFHSAPGRPEVYPVDNQIPLPDTTGGPSMGVYAIRSSLLVFKQRSIWRIFKEADGVYRGVRLMTGVGCAAPNTIKEIPGIGLTFVSESHVELLAGAVENDAVPTQPVHLSTPIPIEMDRLNRSALRNAVSVYSRRMEELQVYVPTLSSADPNQCLVYHGANGEWSTRPGFPVSCALETDDHRQYVIFGSSDTTTNPGLHVLSDGWPLKGASTAISPLIETNDLPLNGQFRAFQPVALVAQVLGVGNNDLAFNLRVNRGMTDVRTTKDTGSQATNAAGDLIKDQQDANQRYQLAVYDATTTLWGTATWGEHHPVAISYPIGIGAIGPCFDLRVKLAPVGRRVGFLALDIEATTGDANKVQVLSSAAGPTTRR